VRARGWYLRGGAIRIHDAGGEPVATAQAPLGAWRHGRDVHGSQTQTRRAAAARAASPAVVSLAGTPRSPPPRDWERLCSRDRGRRRRQTPPRPRHR
jgi:hypothetical protein